MKKIGSILVFLVFLTSLSQTQQTDIILIKNGTIIPVEGDILEKGDILISGGKIKALGQNLNTPTGAKVIDAQGLFVYPGFIDAYTHLGLMEIGSIAATNDIGEIGKENPELNVIWAINPHSVHFKTGRINGTTTALVAPAGGTYPGLSALVKMEGWTIEEMVLQEAATSFINFPMTPRSTRGSRMGPKQETKADVTSKLVEKIKEYLNEARHYLKIKKIAEEDPLVLSPDPSPKFEALSQVLDGTLPVIISVEKAKDIELAIKFIQEEKITAILRGCAQGYMVADKIKEAGIPVILDNLYTGPLDPEESYDIPFRNAGELAKAGVVFCFSSGGDPSISKDLPYHAARSVAFGLDKETALKALTIYPAQIFGVQDRIGSIKKGKDADLFLTTGDPLDLRSEVKHLIINGRDVDLDNWWRNLYNKWNKRPIQEPE